MGMACITGPLRPLSKPLLIGRLTVPKCELITQAGHLRRLRGSADPERHGPCARACKRSPSFPSPTIARSSAGSRGLTYTVEIPRQTQIVIEALAAQAAGAIARIHAESERHRLERQLLEISDREHAHIGQDIHDGLCQHLVSLAFDANSLQGTLAAARRPEARTARRIADYLDQAITEARQLSRGLFPVRLAREGLPPALEELAEATRDRFNIRCRFASEGPAAVENSSWPRTFTALPRKP